MTFDPERVADATGVLPEVLGPGHALLDAVAEVAEVRYRDHLRDGVVLVDPDGVATSPRLFCAVSHEVTDGHSTPHPLSRRVAFVELAEDGSFTAVGPAYLDYRPAGSEERPLVRRALAASPYRDGGVPVARDWAMCHLVPDHVAQVRQSHATAVRPIRVEVTQRLRSEIAYWRARAGRTGNRDRGSESPEVASRRVEELESRLSRRLAELDADGRVVARPPQVLACAVVVPASLLGPPDPAVPASGDHMRAAVGVVVEAERLLGHEVRDRQESSSGWTVRSVQTDGLSRWVDVRMAPVSGRTVRSLENAGAAGAEPSGPSSTGPGRSDSEVRYAVAPFAAHPCR